MKQRHAIAIMLCGLLVMDSCIKDPASELSGVPDGAIMLTSEGYSNSNGAKTSVSGESVQWKSDDKVKINDNDYVVTVTNEGKAYITQGDNPLSGELHGYSPNTLSNPAWNSESKTITVDFPSFFISSFDGTGRQIIDLPMVAYSPTTDYVVKFHHLSAAVKVRVWNDLGEGNALVVDRVVVSCSEYKPCGTVTADFSGGDAPIVTAQSGDSSVAVILTGNNRTVAVGDTLDVQVPILPIGNGSTTTITVKVFAHTTSGTVYRFCKENVTINSLNRNVMLTAGCHFYTGTGNNISVVEGALPCLFTINDKGDQVWFSKGNLQYVGIWQFAENQYDCFWEYQNDDQRDLFGWGTKTNPNYTYVYNSYYSWGEWGENAITNGGNSINYGWRTLSKSEWNYLLYTRIASTVNGKYNARFAKAYLMSSKHGVILFPDSYIHPSGVTRPTGINTNGNTSWSANTYGDAQWTMMELEGAVFLPAEGYRLGEAVSFVGTRGEYWSSTSYSSTNAHHLEILEGSISASADNEYRYGYSVRLVKKAD